MAMNPFRRTFTIALALVACTSLSLPSAAHAGLWDRLKEATEGLIKQEPDDAASSGEQSDTTSAASDEGFCKYLQAPAVGDWVEYRSLKQGEPERQLRQSIVGSEQRAGQTMQWVEMAMTQTGKTERTIIKILAPGYPYRPEEMQDIIMKTGDEPALSMRGPMLMMVRGMIEGTPGLSAAAQCQAMQYVGDASISVPAGEFATRHYRDGESGAELWIAQDISFGIIKSADGGGYVSELIGSGQDAESAITETPRSMFQ